MQNVATYHTITAQILPATNPNRVLLLLSCFLHYLLPLQCYQTLPMFSSRTTTEQHRNNSILKVCTTIVVLSNSTNGAFIAFQSEIPSREEVMAK